VKPIARKRTCIGPSRQTKSRPHEYLFMYHFVATIPFASRRKLLRPYSTVSSSSLSSFDNVAEHTLPAGLVQALRKATWFYSCELWPLFLEFADLMSAIGVEVRSITQTSKCGDPSTVFLHEVLYLLGCAFRLPSWSCICALLRVLGSRINRVQVSP
jgi:hypothetical protein